MSLSDKIARLVRPEVRAMQAYAVADAAGMIKLDAMENPYGWPAEMTQAWLQTLRDVELNRYPDPQARNLKERLRAALDVPADAGILLGNGSDELIQIILLALAAPGACVLAPTPTFVMYELLAVATGMRFVGVPLGEDFALDRAAMLNAIERETPAVVFLAYPNNPTGNLFDVDDIEAVLRATKGVVVVDEAYHAFAGTSFMGRLADFDRLLVMRTLSKQGLAGLRLGMLSGHPAWLQEFDKMRLPYNVGTLTQATADFALRHLDTLDAQAAQLRAERERLTQALQALPGVDVWPSRANFILFRTRTRPATEVFAGLRRAGVLIKNLDRPGSPLAGCLRVTVGTSAENQAFLKALAAQL
jgi:histidinol-phosphate aminotransferase